MGRKYLKGQKGRRANLIRSSDDLANKAGLAEDAEFRHMCILLGVYPRENPKEADSPFPNFHKKDVALVRNHQMTWFVREHTAWLKKKDKKIHRKEMVPKNEPKAPYAELIRSRFPTFADAVQELDDALTTVALFAQLKGSDKIPSEKINRCRELLTEFHYYVSHTHSLKYAFISVRGFHFETEIEGQSVLWLVPHEFTIEEEKNVDYSVLLNFLELYEQLLKFVNTKLFIELGMKYPPDFDKTKWNNGFYFDAIKDSRETKEEEEKEAEPEAEPQNDEKADKLKQALASISENNQSSVNELNEIPEEDRGLFGNYIFTMCRGTPRNAISFIIRSLGGGIIWDEDSDDSRITHTINDRGEIETHFLNRKYVQSQWVVDCLNKRKILDVTLYAPGATLPPHLSPWESIIEGEDQIDENDQREIVAGGDDSDQEIDDEIRRAAMEADYAEGMKAELAGEDNEEEEIEEGTKKQSISQKRAELIKKKKEEKERLAAGTLTMSKMKLYKELKEKEEKKKKPTYVKKDEENEGLNENELEEEEEEEEEKNE